MRFGTSRRRILEMVAATGTIPALTSQAAAQPSPISYGETVTGRITESDPTDPAYPEFHTEPWVFDGKEGDSLTIELSFQGPATPYIHIAGPEGGNILSGSGGSHSITLSSTGRFTIYPQAFQRATPGQYTLSLGASTKGNEQESDEDNSETVPDVEPAYTVEVKALGASPTRAIFSMKIMADENIIDDYESVGGLELGVLGEGLQIARITPLPSQDGDLFYATGSLVLSASSLLGNPVGVAASVVSLSTSTISAAREVRKYNLENSEGTKHALFRGGASEPLLDTVKYLIEIESTNAEISEIVDEEFGVNGWSDTFSFLYQANPNEQPSATENPTGTYPANIIGETSFAKHC